jgi:hypothetical protein
MKEHNIDQEIDFSIIRESRSGITAGNDKKKEKKKFGFSKVGD